MIGQLDDSIAAKASPPGSAARGIIRLSGPNIAAALSACFQSAEGPLEEVQRARWLRGCLHVPPPIRRVTAELAYWPNASSYTRQRSAEIHCVGSPPILDSIMSALMDQGVRQAQPGEFTLRAFLAGRIDLTRAEAVLGVIDARTKREMNVALKQLAGGIHLPLEELRQRLLDLLAQIEAGLDFVEDDIDFISPAEIAAVLHGANSDLQTLLQQLGQRNVNRELKRVVLYGAPNVGKSSLLNALVNQHRALVAGAAGTTRDFVTGIVDLEGMSIEIIDTAGIDRHGLGQPEPCGVREFSQGVTATQRQQADLRILCLDGNRPLTAWESNELRNLDPMTVLIRTKADLPAEWKHDQVLLNVSAISGEGIAELTEEIKHRLGGGEQFSPLVPSTAQRCLASIRAAQQDVQSALKAAESGVGDEVVAAQIRSSLDELAIITGRLYTDDILDRIFSRFCIGK